MGLNTCSLQALVVVAAPGLQGTSSVAVVHGRSCSVAHGFFPEPGSKPMSPGLAGEFFTTE